MGGFYEDWNHRRAGLRPIGYLLRRDGAEHWLRFHSLPESKRNAETQEERQILLSRQNELAREVLGEEPCWLVQTHWVTPAGFADRADANDPFRATREFGLLFAFQFTESEEGEEDRLWNVHALLTGWTAGEFDGLLWDIAEDRAGSTLWMSSTSGAIFAPYDGGVDLFLPIQSMVALLGKAHPDWLSSHPTGL